MNDITEELAVLVVNVGVNYSSVNDIRVNKINQYRPKWLKTDQIQPVEFKLLFLTYQQNSFRKRNVSALFTFDNALSNPTLNLTPPSTPHISLKIKLNHLKLVPRWLVTFTGRLLEILV